MDFGSVVAVDTETMGLVTLRDRLCVVQLSAGDGHCHVVHLTRALDCPNVKALLGRADVTKVFHFARFDLAAIQHYLGVVAAPVFCTKIASRLTRTNVDRHGLKDLCRDLLGIEISKQQQVSDWGADTLSQAQIEYAASDVLHLHALKAKLDVLLDREGRRPLAEACFRFLPDRAALDLVGWGEEDVFSH
ncbi:MAG: ribonuclease D [Alphaproteobacteria bacterium]